MDMDDYDEDAMYADMEGMGDEDDVPMNGEDWDYGGAGGYGGGGLGASGLGIGNMTLDDLNAGVGGMGGGGLGNMSLDDFGDEDEDGPPHPPRKSEDAAREYDRARRRERAGEEGRTLMEDDAEKIE